MEEGKGVLNTAHGNSLQGTVKPLEGLSEEATVELHLPTGSPTVYELDKNLKPIKPMEFLGNEEPMCEVMEAVAAQGKAKKRRQASRLLSQGHPPPIPFLCTSSLHMSVGILSCSSRWGSVAPNFLLAILSLAPTPFIQSSQNSTYGARGPQSKSREDLFKRVERK